MVGFELLDEFTIKVRFSNGETRYVDFQKTLKGCGGDVEALLNPEVFKSVALIDGTLAWSNGIDFDPDGLYEVGKAQLEKLAASVS